MKWFQKKSRSRRKDISASFTNLNLVALQKNYKNFRILLNEHNRVLKAISDMEEKSQGDYLFDINYIHVKLDEIRTGVRTIIEKLNDLGDNRYSALQERFDVICGNIESSLPGMRRIEEDDFTIPLSEIDGSRAGSVGSKNAHLGELRNRLGLAVPDGFAISAWGYKHFMDSNSLQEDIGELIGQLDIRRYDELVRVGDEVREMITSSPVPADLAEAIINSYRTLKERSPSGRIAMRSSAIGEDTHFSFAGQYITFLNVNENEIIDRYREIIASKFTPKAIYYFLSHSISESALAMGVSCLNMVDAAASGVVYTRDPVNPGDGCLVINAIFGLGSYLVDGTLTPDTYRLPRDDGKTAGSRIVKKPVRLVLSEDGGTVEEAVAASEQETPAISEDQQRLLAAAALKIEEYYGSPQDIEWAIDRSGRVFILQSRPVRIIEARAPAVEPDVSQFRVLKSGGMTVCPGAGSGAVYFARSSQSLPFVPEGAVLTAPHPFPGLIVVMDKVRAIVTEIGSAASHMATLAREKQIPTLAGVERIADLPAGEMVTVDATNGVIYAGEHPEVVAARRPEYELFEDTELFSMLEQMLTHITPLTLFNPSDEGFVPENCATIHDMMRYVHQKANEEMFGSARSIEQENKVGVTLTTAIPLPVKIIHIDQNMWHFMGKSEITENEIVSAPMKAFWAGITEEGWPAAPQTDLRGFTSVVTTHFVKGSRQEFLEDSFAILSREYMLFNLRMGYHFSSIEAMCTDDESKNYIRMQYKEGGASMDRRIRRLNLIKEILSLMGFENFSKGDYLDAAVSYQSPELVKKKLRMLGRVSMMTKQLDMVLADDEITRMMTEDFIIKLGLNHY